MVFHYPNERVLRRGSGFTRRARNGQEIGVNSEPIG